MNSHETAVNRINKDYWSCSLSPSSLRSRGLLCCRNNGQHDESLIVVVVGGQTISFNQISGHIVVDQERVCGQGTQPPLPGVHAKLLIGMPVALTAAKPRELYAAAADICDFSNFYLADDKARTQIYCQALDLSERLDKAYRKRNSKKAMDLSSKIDLLQNKLGPDFVALVHALEGIDPESPDGQELASIIESLDESCE